MFLELHANIVNLPWVGVDDLELQLYYNDYMNLSKGKLTLAGRT